MEITIDLETIPGQQEWVKNHIREGITHPGNITKPESIEKWYAEKAEGAFKDKWERTSLDATLGEIICIGWQFNDEEPQGIIRGLDDSEADLISTFYQKIDTRLKEGQGQNRQLHKWIGQNILAFDLPFLFVRTVVNQIKTPIKLPMKAKPWEDTVFDTKLRWGHHTKMSCSLDVIDQALGGKGKDGMDGSKIWPAVLEGRYDDILNYCVNGDVPKTYALYKTLSGYF